MFRRVLLAVSIAALAASLLAPMAVSAHGQKTRHGLTFTDPHCGFILTDLRHGRGDALRAAEKSYEDQSDPALLSRFHQEVQDVADCGAYALQLFQQVINRQHDAGLSAYVAYWLDVWYG